MIPLLSILPVLLIIVKENENKLVEARTVRSET